MILPMTSFPVALRRTAQTLVAAVVVSLASPSSVDADQIKPRAVAELFTSQGCSSCPPADKLWNELATRDDVLALTLPVHYWDYLGWKDTLARAEHTVRQRGYSRALNTRGIYTPQGIVNGAIDVVGSRKAQVLSAVSRAQGLGQSASVDIALDGNTVVVSTNALTDASRDATVWLITYLPGEDVQIGRGENAGRSVRYANIVRELRPLGKIGTGSETFNIKRSSMAPGLKCAVIVQSVNDGVPGVIHAATILTDTL